MTPAVPSGHVTNYLVLQFPRALHALRAPYLQNVRLEARQAWQETLDPRRAVSQGKAYSAMPVIAKNLAWLHQHPHLEGVTITATKVSFSKAFVCTLRNIVRPHIHFSGHELRYQRLHSS